MSFSALHVSLDQHVAEISLNRPDKANALDQTLWTDIQNAFQWADETPEVRAVILRGAGKNFCAGIDLMMLMQIAQQVENPCEGRKREKLHRKILELQGVVSALESCRKPVIAAIHGACVGGAIDLICAADIRVASADAYFAVKEIDVGMTADVGTLQRLPRLVGESVARDWCLTGRRFDAAEADRRGLLSAVLPDAEATLAHARTLAHTITAKSPLAIRGTKEVLNYSRDHTIEDGLKFVATWNAAMLLSNDIQAAVMASMQGQTAQFAD